MIDECLKLDMFLTRLSQADGVLCRWIFKRLAYAADDLAEMTRYKRATWKRTTQTKGLVTRVEDYM